MQLFPKIPAEGRKVTEMCTMLNIDYVELASFDTIIHVAIRYSIVYMGPRPMTAPPKPFPRGDAIFFLKSAVRGGGKLKIKCSAEGRHKARRAAAVGRTFYF